MTRLLFAIILAVPIAASANMLLAPGGSRGSGSSAAGARTCKTVWVDQGHDNFGGSAQTIWINVGC
jgi:hypothetical protein